MVIIPAGGDVDPNAREFINILQDSNYVYSKPTKVNLLSHLRKLLYPKLEKIPVLDLTPLLEGLPNTYYVSNFHWNHRGTELVSEILSKHIQNQLKD